MKKGDLYSDNRGRLWVLGPPEDNPVTLTSYYGLRKPRTVAADDFRGAVAAGYYNPVETNNEGTVVLSDEDRAWMDTQGREA